MTLVKLAVYSLLSWSLLFWILFALALWMSAQPIMVEP